MNFDLSLKWMQASFSTLHASWWRLRLAKLFGKKVTGHDGANVCIGYQYKGVLYMTDFKRGTE